MINFDLLTDIYFFNLGRYQSNDSFFNWTSKSFQKANIFDVKMTRNAAAATEGVFYTILKIDLKLVYYLKKDNIFSIGASPEIQTQLLEAILEYLIKKFFETYDESLLLSCFGDQCDIFNAFAHTVENALKNFENLNLIKTRLVNCKGCNKTIPVIVKNSLIESSEKTNIPLVYNHSGHAILLYFDRQFKIRGHELVDVSY